MQILVCACAHTHTCHSSVAETQSRPRPGSAWGQESDCDSCSFAVCTPSPVCLGVGRAGCIVASAPPPPILSIHKTMCLPQAWGPAGGWERLPGAPAGFPSPGQREKRPPAKKPLRRCPHYITHTPATEPASLRRGASLNAKQDEAPSGRLQRQRSCSFSPQLRVDRVGAKGDSRPQTGERLLDAGRRRRGARGPWEGARAGRAGAGGRGVKCGISCCAVVPDSLPSARGSV